MASFNMFISSPTAWHGVKPDSQVWTTTLCQLACRRPLYLRYTAHTWLSQYNYLLQSISPDREFAKAYYAHSQHCNKHSNSNFQCIEKSEASEFTSNTTDSNCTQIQHLTKLYTLVMKPVLLRSETTHTDTKVVSKTKTSIILVLLVLVL